MYAGKKIMKNDFFIGMVSKNETFCAPRMAMVCEAFSANSGLCDEGAVRRVSLPYGR
jgi:hypothetical protein